MSRWDDLWADSEGYSLRDPEAPLTTTIKKYCATNVETTKGLLWLAIRAAYPPISINCYQRRTVFCASLQRTDPTSSRIWNDRYVLPRRLIR